MELGKRLVAQLEDDADITASWMAHDIAARIEAVETAEPEAKPAAQRACATAILELWRHRNTLPTHLRPFGQLEPIVRTLASLDVDATEHRYYPAALREAATAGAEGDVKVWLDFAIGLDCSARLLIQLALRSAGELAALNAKPWAELARKAGADDSFETPVIRFVLGEEASSQSDKDQRRAALNAQLSRLEAFIDIASTLADAWRAQLSSEDREQS